MDDGTEDLLEAGDTAVVPPGHEGWAAGDETTVYVDFARIAG